MPSARPTCFRVFHTYSAVRGELLSVRRLNPFTMSMLTISSSMCRSLYNPIQALPNVAAAKSLHESLERGEWAVLSKRRPGRGQAWPARRCPGRSAGPGERRLGPLVAVLVGALLAMAKLVWNLRWTQRESWLPNTKLSLRGKLQIVKDCFVVRLVP